MADASTFLVLQHATCEPPAAYAEELAARGFDLRCVELDLGESLPPDWGEFAGIVAMGGPMGAYETEAHGWLEAELAFIAAAVDDDLPFWGVCLGAQLLAAALGARVHPGERPEVGVLPVRSTPEAAADSVFAAAPARYETLQWHGDTYELPEGAIRLAESDAYPQQAFRVKRAFGLQFHLEVPPELVAEWAALPAYAESLERSLGEGALHGLIAEVTAIAPDSTRLARDLFGRWLDEAVGPPPTR